MTDSCSINNCPHCGASPSLRNDKETGLFIVACMSCKTYGETGTEPHAIGSWNTFAQAHRLCLGCGSAPTLKHSRLRQMYVMACTKCQWQGNLSHTVQGAVTAWHSSQKPGDLHILDLWNRRANELRSST